MQVKQVEKIYLDYNGSRPTKTVTEVLQKHGFHYDKVYKVWKATNNEKSQAFPTEYMPYLGRSTVTEIEITFDGKPSEEIRNKLKLPGHDFLWNKWEKIWYSKFTQERWDFAQNLSSTPIATTPSTSYTIAHKAANPSSNLAKARDKADKLRALADKMYGIINDKLNPAIGQQRSTYRRDRIAHGIRMEGYKLQKVQELLYGLANALDAGNLVSTPLANISNRAQIDSLMGGATFPCWDDGEWRNYDEDRERLAKIGITESNFMQWHKELMALACPQQDRQLSEQEKLKKLEGEVARSSIPGYFPTPPDVVRRLIELAQIEGHHNCWEPSAGSGAIADELVKISGWTYVSEIWYELRQILKLKGHDVISHNCFDVDRTFDRIVANPPWGIGTGASAPEHIQHYYKCLAPGGRLVSLCDEGAFFRDYKEDKEFREWLGTVGGKNEKLPPGSFLNSTRSTGANMRIVIIDKPLVGGITPANNPANNIVPLSRQNEALSILESLSNIATLPTLPTLVEPVPVSPKPELLSLLDEIQLMGNEITASIQELRAMQKPVVEVVEVVKITSVKPLADTAKNLSTALKKLSACR